MHCEKSWHLSLSRSEKSRAQEGKRGQALVSAFHGKKCWGMSKRNPPPPDSLTFHERLMLFNCSYFNWHAWNAKCWIPPTTYNLLKPSLVVHFYRAKRIKNSKSCIFQISVSMLLNYRPTWMEPELYLRIPWNVYSDFLRGVLAALSFIHGYE